jgi:lipopolysaccharide/colanic/teichoic acid biosynthesis glycosyltransferase
MTGRNALSIAESSALEPLNNYYPAAAQHDAIVYPWESASSSFTSAFTRANSFRYHFVKRAFDIVVSALLLSLLWPLGLTIALLIKLSSPGPIFYYEERVGRFRTPFRIIKFRSMYIERPRFNVFDISTAQGHTCCADRIKKRGHDPRITPVGRVLRRMSLDELPQLWNVLLGNMSLVGPRPIVESERKFYGRYLPLYDLMTPGITGLWQVSGRSDVDYDKRVSLDRDYARCWSCLLDLKILARTIPAVLTMRGAY